MRLKESCPLLGATVDHHGVEYEVIGQTIRRGQRWLVGRPFGSDLTYWLNPNMVEVLDR